MKNEQETAQKLRNEWFCCLGEGKEQEEIIEDLIKRYSEKDRHYHATEHVKMCLDELALVEKIPAFELGEPCNIMTMTYAILFHDAVYDPKAKDDNNVRASAELWKKQAEKMGLIEYVIKDAYDLILVTDHKTKRDTLHKKLMVDLDLVILGKDEKTFFDYDKNIRKEYAHVPWKEFGERRADILERFLEKDHIYNTTEFRERYEKKAEENLKKCIARLRDPETKDYLISDQ